MPPSTELLVSEPFKEIECIAVWSPNLARIEKRQVMDFLSIHSTEVVWNTGRQVGFAKKLWAA